MVSGMAKKKSEPFVAPTRFEFETFRAFGHYNVGQLEDKEPSAFNGRVAFRKWRIIAEQLDEPNEILQERLKKLWRECDNHHLVGAIDAAAREVGLTLDPSERGIDVPTRRP